MSAPNPLFNLPFFLQAIGRGSQGFAEGQQAADEHQRMQQTLAIQRTLMPLQMQEQQGRIKQLGYENQRLAAGNKDFLPMEPGVKGPFQQAAGFDPGDMSFNEADKIAAIRMRARMISAMHNPLWPFLQERAKQHAAVKQQTAAMIKQAQGALQQAMNANDPVAATNARASLNKATAADQEEDDSYRHVTEFWGGAVGVDPGSLHQLLGGDDSDSEPSTPSY